MQNLTCTWEVSTSASDWLANVDLDCVKSEFNQNGFLRVEHLLDQQSLSNYQSLYDRFLSGEIDASNHRHDLGSHVKSDSGNKENITQIMWPSHYIDGLRDGPIHQRLELLSKALLGEDMAFDFDMMISKPPHSDVPTPWHQDESYWLDMPDKRTVSFWVALQDVNKDNGCMWFVPGSHLQPLREHKKVREGHHANRCDCSEDEGSPQPLLAGGCTGHHGRTLHYTRGNSSSGHRRAFIVNYRPLTMVEYERNNNYDHGLSGIELLKKTHDGSTN